MNIALCQINSVVGDFATNHQTIIDYAHRAAQSDATIALFPELALCGYQHRDLIYSPDFIQQQQRYLQSVIDNAPPQLHVVFGHIDYDPKTNRYYNTLSVVHRHALIFRQHKQALPTYDIFDEQRYYSAGNNSATVAIGAHNIGLAICEDMWSMLPPTSTGENSTSQHSEHGTKHTTGLDARITDSTEPNNRNRVRISTATRHSYVNSDSFVAVRDVDVLLIGAASPYENHKPLRRQEILQQIAISYRCWVVYVNTVNSEDGVVFDGGSYFYSPDGMVRAALPHFTECLEVVPIDQTVNNNGAESTPSKDVEHAVRNAKIPIVTAADRYRLMKQALQFALKEYVTKNRFNKVCFGLSGGIDSAVVAVLAADALGKQHVTALLLPSQYNHQQSLDDALELVTRLGISHHILSIETLHTTVLETMKPTLVPRGDMEPTPTLVPDSAPTHTTNTTNSGRTRPAIDQTSADWAVATENIQARIRGLLIMAYANGAHSLALATGNRSELATGYCTLYGDMCGSLALIGDVYKTEVYELAHHINKHQQLIPQSIIDKAPSAELRPNQKDSDSLPDYPTLDAILKHYLDDRLSIEQIIKQGYNRDTVCDIVAKVHNSEYKRTQAPPVVRLNASAFGTGRRVVQTHAFR